MCPRTENDCDMWDAYLNIFEYLNGRICSTCCMFGSVGDSWCCFFLFLITTLCVPVSIDTPYHAIIAYPHHNWMRIIHTVWNSYKNLLSLVWMSNRPHVQCARYLMCIIIFVQPKNFHILKGYLIVFRLAHLIAVCKSNNT